MFPIERFKTFLFFMDLNRKSLQWWSRAVGSIW